MWDFLFGNIEEKLKKLACIFFLLMLIVGIIVGINIMVEGQTLIGFLVIIITGILAYLISMFCYAFGELIDCTQRIAYNTRNKKDKE